MQAQCEDDRALMIMMMLVMMAAISFMLSRLRPIEKRRRQNQAVDIRRATATRRGEREREKDEQFGGCLYICLSGHLSPRAKVRFPCAAAGRTCARPPAFRRGPAEVSRTRRIEFIIIFASNQAQTTTQICQHRRLFSCVRPPSSARCTNNSI